MSKRARVAVEKEEEEEEEHALMVKDIVFPKSEFEYDRSLEPEIKNDSGLQIRSLLQTLKSFPTTSSSISPSLEEEESDFAPISLPQATTTTATTPSSNRNSTSSLPSQNFSLREWVTSPGTPSTGANIKTCPLITLHNEIISYRNFVAPGKEELDARKEVLLKVRAVATELWPRSKTEIFGSFATGLCLPESDVDIVVFNAPKNAIHQLSREFAQRKMTDNMEVIGRAKVPIVKLKFKNSKYPCDVCFDQHGGLQSAKLIKRVCDELPEVKCLVLIIKHFLAQRGLNNTYQGGMGSYLCFLTCVALVQRCRKLFPPERLNLGFLLLEYFNFYANVLDVERVGISLLDGGTFFTKSSRDWYDGERGFLLCMEDPVNTENDVGRNTRSMGMIKRAFGLAHTELKAKLDNFTKSNARSQLGGGGRSNMILTSVIRLNHMNNSSVYEFSDSEEEDEMSEISDVSNERAW